MGRKRRDNPADEMIPDIVANPIGLRVLMVLQKRPGWTSMRNTAEKIGVNGKVLSDWLTGRRDVSNGNAWRYFVLLRMSPEELAEIFRKPESDVEIRYFSERKQTYRATLAEYEATREPFKRGRRIKKIEAKPEDPK